MAEDSAQLQAIARRRGPPRGRTALPFAGVALSILGMLHFYVWYRVVVGSGVGPVAAGALGALVLVGAFTVAWTLFTRILGRAEAPWVAVLGYTWLGLVFLAFSLSVVAEPFRWLLPLAGFDAAAASRAVSGATLAAVAVFGAYGLFRSRRPVITRTKVKVRGLDPSLRGFRIVQISDLHVGNTIDRGFVARIVAAANAQSPDLIAVTGDLVDGSVDALRADVAPLGDLKARHGVFFVTGNHEYYSGAPAWIAHLTSLGFRVLRNERVRIAHGAAGFDLAGVDDLFGSMIPEHGIDLEQALRGRDPSVPAVLLSHQPVTVDLAERAGVALQLSGHTHGGQIFPFHFLVRTQQPYLGGLVQHGNTALYVHRGTGYWGPPFRVGAPSEVAVLELEPA